MSDDDWDTPSASASTAVPNAAWEGEDADEPELDSWDAEPEEKPAAAPKPEHKPRAPTKRELQKKEEEEKKAARKDAESFASDPARQLAEKIRRQQLEENRDMDVTADLFGVSVPRADKGDSKEDESKPNLAIPSTLELKGGMRLECAELSTDAHMEKFAVELGKRLEKEGKTAQSSARVAKLIKALIDETAKLGILRLDDAGEIKRYATVKHNDMTNAAKKVGGKKAPAKAAPTLKATGKGVDKFGFGDDDNYAEDDFM